MDPEIPAEEIRREADRILGRPEYEVPGPSLWERALDWLFDRLPDIPSFAGAGGSTIGWVLIVIMVALVLWLLWKFLPRRFGRLRRPERITVETETLELPTRRQWLARAAEAEAEGRWAEAVRARYRALVAGLVDRDVLEAEPGVTSSAHRRRVDTRAGGVARPFGEATGRFEDVWYGLDQAADADSRRLATLDDTILDGGDLGRSTPADAEAVDR